MSPSIFNTPSSSSSSSSLLRNIFDYIDSDGDGRISREDLISFFQDFSSFSSSVHSSENDDFIGNMIALADSDKDGFVDYDDFERILLGPSCSSSSSDLFMKSAFRVMDRDGDGVVGFEDLRDHMKSAGVVTGDDGIRSMLSFLGDSASYTALVPFLAMEI